MHRKNFERFLSRQGVNVVYVRADRSLPCDCGGADCPRCFGLGYVCSVKRTHIILAKGRSMLSGEADRLPGLISETSYRAYFEVDDRPDVGDLVLEVDWKSYTLLHVYRIEYADTMTFDGEPAYCIAFLDNYDHYLSSVVMALERR